MYTGIKVKSLVKMLRFDYYLKCISHSGLNGTIEILKVRIITSITAVSYTTVANRLSTVVSELLGYITNTLNIS